MSNVQPDRNSTILGYGITDICSAINDGRVTQTVEVSAMGVELDPWVGKTGAKTEVEMKTVRYCTIKS